MLSAQALPLNESVEDSAWLVEFMTACGIPAVSNYGVCFGRGMMAIIAMIQNQLSSNDALHQNFHDAHQNKRWPSVQQLAYLNTVQLFNSPASHKFLTDTPLQLTQSTAVQPVLDYLAAGVSRGYIQLDANVHALAAFTGAYSKALLESYLLTLSDAARDTSAQLNHALPLLLSSPEHTVALGFNPSTNRWSLTDTTSQVTRFLDTVATARDALWAIFTAFHHADHITFSTRGFADDAAIDVSNQIMNAWRSNPTFIKIHTVGADLPQQVKSRWLLVAAIDGDDVSVDSLLTQGVNVDFSDERNNTPLFNAATNGRSTVVEKLCRAPGIKINEAAGPINVTALWNAVSYGWTETVTTLLEHDADANIARLHDGETPLMTASRRGLTGVALKLIPQSNVHLTNNSGQTALYFAAIFGKTDIVRALLAAGADPEPTAKDGTTLLYTTNYYLKNPSPYHAPEMLPNLKQSIELIESHIREKRLQTATPTPKLFQPVTPVPVTAQENPIVVKRKNGMRCSVM